jgi:hypothetical protein
MIDKKFPLLKILIPGQATDERGIEVEFPEHVTGVNTQTENVKRFYLITACNRYKRSLPVWKVTDTSLIYECEFNNNLYHRKFLLQKIWPSAMKGFPSSIEIDLNPGRVTLYQNRTHPVHIRTQEKLELRATHYN